MEVKMKYKAKELKAAGLVRVYDPSDWFWGEVIFFLLAVSPLWIMVHFEKFNPWLCLFSIFMFIFFLFYLIAKSKAKSADKKMRTRIKKRDKFIVYDQEGVYIISKKDINEFERQTFGVALDSFLFFVWWMGVWERDPKIKALQIKLTEKKSQGKEN